MAQVYFTAPASATPVDRQALRDAWIALLGRWEWEWFCTFTFRDLVHPEAADKRFRVLISQANRVLYGVRWHKHGAGLRWVSLIEQGKRRLTPQLRQRLLALAIRSGATKDGGAS
jgi:hypothetical protein